MTHICVRKLIIIGSDNGLSPGWHQAIIWTYAGILLIWNLQTNFSEILGQICTFSLKKMQLKMPSGYWRPFCLSLDMSTKFCSKVNCFRMSGWWWWFVVSNKMKPTYFPWWPLPWNHHKYPCFCIFPLHFGGMFNTHTHVCIQPVRF